MSLPSVTQNVVSIVLATLVSIVVFLLTHTFFQNTSHRVLIRGYFTDDMEVTVSSVSGQGKVGVLDRFQVKAKENPKQPQYEGSKAMNLPLAGLQLDFQTKQQRSSASKIANIKLTSIEVRKPYQKNYHYVGKNINGYFTSDQAIDGQANSYQFDANNRVTIRSKQPIRDTNWPLVLVLPALFFLGSWLLFKNSAWASIPAFADMSLGNRISSNGEFDVINGLRGIAALLVLLSHTAPGYEALQMGLALLFVLSGFLLSKPFVIDNKKIFSWRNLERYITKRLKRILPMYYLYIFLIYIVTFKFDVALRHIFFVQAEGHLWPMTQIFAFYMLLPLVLLVTCLSHRLHRSLPLLILAIVIYLCVQNMRGWTPFYNGAYSHEFFLYAFLIGVLASYLQYDLIGQRGLEIWGKRWVRELVGAVAFLVTVYAIAWSGPMKPEPEILRWVSQFWVKCFACVAIILLALNTPGTVYRWLVSNRLFRSVGVIGFSFYILHGLGMQIFEHIQMQYLGHKAPGARGWDFMFGAFCVTYVMAVITYSYVERPFFGYREKIAKESQT